MLYYPLTFHDTFHPENQWAFWKIGVWLHYNASVSFCCTMKWIGHSVEFNSVQFSRSIVLFATPGTAASPGLPAHHQLPGPAQTHVHLVSDAIHPSHPLSSPLPPDLNLFQHQGLSSESVLLIRWPKYWSFSFSISPSNEHPGLISFRMDCLDLLAVLESLKREPLERLEKTWETWEESWASAVKYAYIPSPLDLASSCPHPLPRGHHRAWSWAPTSYLFYARQHTYVNPSPPTHPTYGSVPAGRPLVFPSEGKIANTSLFQGLVSPTCTTGAGPRREQGFLGLALKLGKW